MIAKHSDEQSQKGEGVEVVKNEDCHDEVHGKGRFTEKRVYLSRYHFKSTMVLVLLYAPFHISPKFMW